MSLTGLVASAVPVESQSDAWAELEYRVKARWGEGNGLFTTATVWVGYEPDLAKRSVVDLAKCVASIQILLNADDDSHRELLQAHFRQGLANLILNDANHPAEMMTSAMAEAAAILFEGCIGR